MSCLLSVLCIRVDKKSALTSWGVVLIFWFQLKVRSWYGSTSSAFAMRYKESIDKG